ncbi:MAG: diaminopimelate decarboxylase [Ignavibacteriota bacterium]|nr:diaminopimelate decarboxylase [Ignavibacteriales bacterium]MBL1121832.1 diaminopimelate decarboxylase [Ignavibacteriota bacterium]MCC7095408.1 diaminopimelate decarboxylase [Ignavibacteriaceae bacterium]MCE7855277.1 diaminopimelate decarboxylase [Ignavibacteria bacterium CHB3]MEB2297069.1 diaminopimelate decarboxylase [Ignavibacteria bacterium]
MLTKEIISKFSQIETPFYYYDIKLLQKTLDEIVQESSKKNYKLHYALKANSNDRILQIISNAGLGADCVSGNEITKAVSTGFKSSELVFAGVGKSDKEILTGLTNDILCFNVESKQELEVINSIAISLNKIANVALRINPNINANTHHYITTGLEENKFGINIWELSQVLDLISSLMNIKLIGLHFHIGSQVTDLDVYKGLCLRINEIQKWFSDRNFRFEYLNAGGGLGINYESPDSEPIPDFKSYFEVFEKFLVRFPDQQVHFEIGRAIVGQCGSLISKVLYVKEGINTNFIILDAGMTELIRPALYQSYHKIENLTSNGKAKRYDVVGPICESSDTFAKYFFLPETERGNLIAIRSTGAYGEVMSSEYNLRDKIQSYFSDRI